MMQESGAWRHLLSVRLTFANKRLLHMLASSQIKHMRVDMVDARAMSTESADQDPAPER